MALFSRNNGTPAASASAEAAAELAKAMAAAKTAPPGGRLVVPGTPANDLVDPPKGIPGREPMAQRAPPLPNAPLISAVPARKSPQRPVPHGSFTVFSAARDAHPRSNTGRASHQMAWPLKPHAARRRSPRGAGTHQGSVPERKRSDYLVRLRNA